MRISLITPAPPNSLSGNRCTAVRWANIFEALGHEVLIAEKYADEDVDMMLALHAWRSADSIERFHEIYPERRLIVSLTGTDAYRFIHSHPEITLRSIELADRLVGLHALIANTVPEQYRHKVSFIYQSAEYIPERDLDPSCFRVCVAGHLRDEKDSLRPAYAVRNLPNESRIQIHHYGKPHTEQWGEDARQEVANNQRYHWHGEIDHEQLNQAYRQSHLLVLPSRMEGGANVISEAVMAGLPVIASDIEGSIGLLGEDYLGYYPVEDEEALATLLLKAETDSEFYQQLVDQCLARQALFKPEAEAKGWQDVIA